MRKNGMKVFEKIREDARNDKLKLNETIRSIFSIPFPKLHYMMEDEKEKKFLGDISDYFLIKDLPRDGITGYVSHGHNLLW